MNLADIKLGASLIDCSSEIFTCEASNTLVSDLSSIWLSDGGPPQWICISLKNVADNDSLSSITPLSIRSLGWHCWHSYTTNPKIVKIHISSDGSKFRVWDQFIATSQRKGSQIFFCVPIILSIYPFIVFEVVETFGGSQTYMNQVYLYTEEITPSSDISVLESFSPNFPTLPLSESQLNLARSPEIDVEFRSDTLPSNEAVNPTEQSDSSRDELETLNTSLSSFPLRATQLKSGISATRSRYSSFSQTFSTGDVKKVDDEVQANNPLGNRLHNLERTVEDLTQKLQDIRTEIKFGSMTKNMKEEIRYEFPQKKGNEELSSEDPVHTSPKPAKSFQSTSSRSSIQLPERLSSLEDQLGRLTRLLGSPSVSISTAEIKDAISKKDLLVSNIANAGHSSNSQARRKSKIRRNVRPTSPFPSPSPSSDHLPRPPERSLVDCSGFSFHEYLRQSYHSGKDTFDSEDELQDLERSLFDLLQLKYLKDDLVPARSAKKIAREANILTRRNVDVSFLNLFGSGGDFPNDQQEPKNNFLSYNNKEIEGSKSDSVESLLRQLQSKVARKLLKKAQLKALQIK